MITWAGSRNAGDRPPPGVVVEGAYAHRDVIQPAQEAGRVVSARWRRDAQLYDLPPTLKPGPKRGPGRPPTDGRNRLSRAQRAGHQQGWQTIDVASTTGPRVTQTVQTFRATWPPAGGLVRVLILKEVDGSWRAYLGPDPEARVAEIVPAVLDRWSIAQNFPDWKEVEGIRQVQWRRVWSNVGALNRNLGVHSLVELWGGVARRTR